MIQLRMQLLTCALTQVSLSCFPHSQPHPCTRPCFRFYAFTQNLRTPIYITATICGDVFRAAAHYKFPVYGTYIRSCYIPASPVCKTAWFAATGIPSHTVLTCLSTHPFTCSNTANHPYVYIDACARHERPAAYAYVPFNKPFKCLNTAKHVCASIDDLRAFTCTRLSDIAFVA